MEDVMTFAKDGYHLAAGDGDTWWFLDTRMTVKVAAGQSGGAFTLIEWSAPPGFGPPRHVHNEEDEAFYVLDGAMRVVCGSTTWEASAGSLVFLPRGIEHAFVVLGEAPIRGLQITNPAGFEDFVAELGRRPQTPGLPTPQPPDIARINEAGLRRGSPTVGPPLAS
jgi:quercetin dioxygenase-like cupin family protein